MKINYSIILSQIYASLGSPLLSAAYEEPSKTFSYRSSLRKMLLLMTSSPSLPIYIGELGKRWQFPSDHLPIGIAIDNLHFANWNILNTEYLKHIESNSQGLKDSLILALNLPSLNDPRLTLREELVLEQTLDLLQHPDRPRSVLSLQETGENFWEVSKERLPGNFKALTAFQNGLSHEDVFIYDANLFQFVNLESKRYDFKPTNTLMALTLRERSTNRLFRIIQSHVPGGPDSEPARVEMADFAMRNYDPSMVMIVMGDMNRPSEDFIQLFERIALENSIEQPYRAARIPYPTHINTKREASRIDNLFYAIPHETQIKVSSEADFFPAVQEMARMIREFSAL